MSIAVWRCLKDLPAIITIKISFKVRTSSAYFLQELEEGGYVVEERPLRLRPPWGDAEENANVPHHRDGDVVGDAHRIQPAEVLLPDRARRLSKGEEMSGPLLLRQDHLLIPQTLNLPRDLGGVLLTQRPQNRRVIEGGKRLFDHLIEGSVGRVPGIYRGTCPLPCGVRCDVIRSDVDLHFPSDEPLEEVLVLNRLDWCAEAALLWTERRHPLWMMEFRGDRG